VPEKNRDAFLDRYGHLALGALPVRWRVSACCLRCAHRGEVPVRYLIDSRQVHASTRLEDLPRMLRCARCDCRHVRLSVESENGPGSAPQGRSAAGGEANVVPLGPRRRR
jgi:hypothetical protein